MVDEVKILERYGKAVKAPEYSHTTNRIYAILQDGKLKHLAYYDENHKLKRSIDFFHLHDGKSPHVHHDLFHKGNVTDPTYEDQIIIDKVLLWIKNNKR